MKYTGIPCAACKKPFEDGDDIVVCPECGTPYHRACYKELGHCIHEQRHAEGYLWQPPKTAPGPSVPLEEGGFYSVRVDDSDVFDLYAHLEERGSR